MGAGFTSGSQQCESRTSKLATATHHWIIRCQPLSIELQTHLVPLLGLLWRSVIGVAMSGSVTVVDEASSNSNFLPNPGGEDCRGGTACELVPGVEAYPAVS